jgi:hypothetical protein
MNKNIKKTLIGITIVVVLVIALLPKVFSTKESGNNTVPGTIPNMAVPVKAHIVSLETLSNSVYTTGTILANEEV